MTGPEEVEAAVESIAHLRRSDDIHVQALLGVIDILHAEYDILHAEYRFQRRVVEVATIALGALSDESQRSRRERERLVDES